MVARVENSRKQITPEQRDRKPLTIKALGAMVLAPSLFFGTGIGIAIGYTSETNSAKDFTSDCPGTPSAAQRKSIIAEAASKDAAVSPGKLRHFGLISGQKLAPPPQSTIAELRSSANPVAATKVASQYTQSAFGFGVSLNMPKNKIAHINTKIYEKELVDFIYFASLVPAKLVQASGTSHVAITNIAERTSRKINGEIYYDVGDFTQSTGNVNLDINSVGDISTISHEILGHGIQDAVCNGAQAKDPAIADANPASFHYQDTGIEAGLHRIKHVTSTGYGRTNVQEDNAELTSTFTIEGPAATAELKHQTPEGEKLATILTRLDTIDPGSVAFMHAAQETYTQLQDDYTGLGPAYA